MFSQRLASYLKVAALAASSVGCREVTVVTHSKAPSDPPTCGQVTKLAEGITDAIAMAYANDAIYVARGFTGSSDIVRIPLSSGSPAVLSQGLQTVIPTGLVSDGMRLYAVGVLGTVAKVAFDGSTTLGYVYGGSDSPHSVPTSTAIDDTHLYVARSDGSINRVSLATWTNGADIEQLSPAVADAWIDDMAVDGVNVYWLENTLETHILKKLPLSGGVATMMMSGPSSLKRLAVYGSYVYVSAPGASPDGSDGSITQVRIDGQGQPVLVPATAAVGVAADTSGVYWGGGKDSPAPVEHLPIGGGTPITLSDQNLTFVMKPCGDGICWIDDGTGDVWRYQECSP